MSTRTQRDKEKKSQERYQGVLARLLREEENKYCADCDAKGPRWASWNLGLFVCIRCAGIHRNLGVHISRVKSVNLDSWTEEQIDSMDNMGNQKARAIYEAHLPHDFRRPQTDSSLEHFIRCKYERKMYMDKAYVPAPAKKKPVRVEESDKEILKKKRERRARTSSLTLPKPEEADRSHGAQPVLQPAQQNLASAQLAASPPKTSSIPNSPSSTSPQTQQQPQQPAKQSAAADLLGLDNPGPSSSDTDLFGLSMNNTPVINPNQDLMQQKENQNPLDEPLFDAAATGEDKKPESKKNTKDSIMALYGSSSTSQTVYNVPGGVYMPQTQTQNQFNMPQQMMSNGPTGTSIMGNGPTTGLMANNLSSGLMGNNPSSGLMGNTPSSGLMANGPSSGLMASVPSSSGLMASVPSSGLMSNGPSTGMMAKAPTPTSSAAGMMYGQQSIPHAQPQASAGSMAGGFNPMMAQPQQHQQQQHLMYNAQQQYLQQQYQNQMQQVQQVQQQMQALRVGTHPANTQMGWQQASAGIPQGIPATAGAGAGGWGAMTTGHTHSTQLWK